MKLTASIVKKAAWYVADYMDQNLHADFIYHNLDHTKFVVRSVEKISDALNASDHEKLVLKVAAWFHDLGYTKQIDDHEKWGAWLAENFLREFQIDEEDVQSVRACILSTRYPQKPSTLLEQIICDADMMHLSKKDFIASTGNLRKEWEVTKKRYYTDEEWHQLNVEFISGHSFHTSYGKEKREKKKQANIKKLRTRMKSAKIVKGVETLFKNSSRNHMELSAMADNKAHILLSISSLIVSIILSFSVTHLAESNELILPTALLLVVCLTTIVLAVLTTKPKISKGVSTAQQIREQKVNLLFFGNFHKMELSEYERRLHELMQNKEYMYSTMTRDIYYLGKVLAVKYRYLAIGYKVFMFGLIASTFAFAASIILSNGTAL